MNNYMVKIRCEDCGNSMEVDLRNRLSLNWGSPDRPARITHSYSRDPYIPNGHIGHSLKIHWKDKIKTLSSDNHPEKAVNNCCKRKKKYSSYSNRIGMEYSGYSESYDDYSSIVDDAYDDYFSFLEEQDERIKDGDSPDCVSSPYY